MDCDHQLKECLEPKTKHHLHISRERDSPECHTAEKPDCSRQDIYSTADSDKTREMLQSKTGDKKSEEHRGLHRWEDSGTGKVWVWSWNEGTFPTFCSISLVGRLSPTGGLHTRPTSSEGPWALAPLKYLVLRGQLLGVTSPIQGLTNWWFLLG